MHARTTVNSGRHVMKHKHQNLYHSDLCDELDCDAGYECLIYEPTNEAYCSPNCDDLNPCGATEECQIDPVRCVRAPCPGVLSCVGKYSQRQSA